MATMTTNKRLLSSAWKWEEPKRSRSGGAWDEVNGFKYLIRQKKMTKRVKLLPSHYKWCKSAIYPLKWKVKYFFYEVICLIVLLSLEGEGLSLSHILPRWLKGHVFEWVIQAFSDMQISSQMMFLLLLKQVNFIKQLLLQKFQWCNPRSLHRRQEFCQQCEHCSF